MKCNQSRLGFDLVSPCPFPATIAIRPRAPPKSIILYKVYSKQVSDPKAPFSIATTIRCKEEHYSFPWILVLIILKIKQRASSNIFESLVFLESLSVSRLSPDARIHLKKSHCATLTRFVECVTNAVICWLSRSSQTVGAHVVMVIVVGIVHGDTSSKPGGDWLHFT